MSRRSARAPLSITGVVAMSLLLAACGGSGSTTTKATASAEETREQQLIQLAKCLREHGVSISTPTAGAPFRIRDLRGNRQAFEVARTACKQYVPKFGAANLSPAERVAREEAVRKFAKCMREHGVPLEVETSAGPGLGIRVHLGAGGPNRESPAFEAAARACSGLLPKGRGGGRGLGLGLRGGRGGGSRGTNGSGGAASPAPAGAEPARSPQAG